MKKVLAAFLCLAIPFTVFASDNGYKVTYDGGSLTDQKSGTGMKLFIEANQIRLMRDKSDVVSIPATAITEISYGQDVHRRRVPHFSRLLREVGISANGLSHSGRKSGIDGRNAPG